MMTIENLFQKWVEENTLLHEVIQEIDATGKSYYEMAEMAFHKLPEVYNIPKMPADTYGDDEDESDRDECRSLF